MWLWSSDLGCNQSSAFLPFRLGGRIPLQKKISLQTTTLELEKMQSLPMHALLAPQLHLAGVGVYSSALSFSLAQGLIHCQSPLLPCYVLESSISGANLEVCHGNVVFSQSFLDSCIQHRALSSLLRSREWYESPAGRWSD